MNFKTNLNVRKQCVSVVCLLLLVVLTFYIASERREMISYAPGSPLRDDSYFFSDTSISRGEESLSKDGKAFITNRTLEKGRLTSSSSSLSTTLSSPTSRPSAVSLVKYKTKSGTAGSSKRTQTNTITSGHLQGSKDFTINDNSSYISNELLDFNPVGTIKDLNLTIKKFDNETFETVGYNLLDETEQNGVTSEQIHRVRIQRITKACSNKEELFKNIMYRGYTRPVMYRSQRYKFNYCKVPKCGSTFWTKVFGVLRNGLLYADNIFKTSRRQVHGSMIQYMTNIERVIKDQSRTIIVSRDPYSRLFSAYIDKSYLQLMRALNYKIRHINNLYDKNVCPTDVTFQEFLEWIVNESEGGKTFDRHWAPIFSLCYPCAINPFILVKQETFSRDVEFALKQLDVEKPEFDYILRALHDNRVELSLPGIIETLFLFASKQTCLGFDKCAQRIWISLQIQGFIDEKIEYPVVKFNQIHFSNNTYFTEVVLQTLRQFPMSSSQSKSQRQKYLYRAYRSVKPNTLRRIQELYKQDFEMFGYSKLPPTEIFTHYT